MRAIASEENPMRSALFRCALVIVVYVCLEVFSYAAFWLIERTAGFWE